MLCRGGFSLLPHRLPPREQFSNQFQSTAARRVERLGRRKLCLRTRVRSEAVEAASHLALRAESTSLQTAPAAEGGLVEPLVSSSPVDPGAASTAALSADLPRSSPLTEASKTATEALDNLKNLSGKATGAVSDSVQQASDVASSSYKNATQQIQSLLDNLSAQATGLGDDANEAVQKTIQSIQSSLGELQSQAVDAVPPEVKNAFEVIQPYLQKATEIAVTYRTPLLIGSVSLLALATVSYYNRRFVGYSGDILPTKVLELLQSDAPALLIDIRPETVQDRDGIPKLRKSALGKAISVPFCRDEPELKGVRRTAQFNADITAAYIAGHKQVSRFTNLVIMGDDGAQARSVARALANMDCPNSFVMLDGFSAWQQADLPVAESPQYEVNVVDVVADRALEFTEPLKKPSTLIPVSLAVASAAWAIWNYRYVLKLLGVVGPTAGLVFYLLKKYDTLEEFLDDLNTALASTATTETTSEPDSVPSSIESESTSSAAESTTTEESTASDASETVVAEP